MKRVFVTGAAGFIGSHLCKRLKARGDAVLGYDNFNDYYDPSLKRLRVSGLDVVEGDICDAAALEAAALGFGPTHIVNLAAQAGVRYSLERPQAYVASNVEGFVNVLELCRKLGGVKLTYASSSSVYGLNEKVPFSPEERTDRQASLYGATKKANELIAGTYRHLYGIPVTGLRYFTVYGPWGRPDMAYYSFSEKILAGEPIRIFNRGEMRRDFTYIDDIVEGTVAAIDLGADCEIFNLGNNSPVALLDFVAALERALGRKALLEFAPMQKGDVVKTFADIEKSRRLLGFSPKTTLEEGLERFAAWFGEFRSAPAPTKKA